MSDRNINAPRSGGGPCWCERCEVSRPSWIKRLQSINSISATPYRLRTRPRVPDTSSLNTYCVYVKPRCFEMNLSLHTTSMRGNVSTMRVVVSRLSCELLNLEQESEMSGERRELDVQTLVRKVVRGGSASKIAAVTRAEATAGGRGRLAGHGHG